MSNPIILLDVSGSMAEPVGTRRRIDVLADILDQVRDTVPGVRVFTFASTVREIKAKAHVPEPGGGTDLAGALKQTAPLNPSQVIVISDGEPNDAQGALIAARTFTNCVFRTYFCGDETNHAAIAFLRALSWTSSDGMGSTALVDLRRPQVLKEELRLALAGPAS